MRERTCAAGSRSCLAIRAGHQSSPSTLPFNRDGVNMLKYNVLVCSKPHLKPRNRKYDEGVVWIKGHCAILYDDAGRELACVQKLPPDLDVGTCEDCGVFDGCAPLMAVPASRSVHSMQSDHSLWQPHLPVWISQRAIDGPDGHP